MTRIARSSAVGGPHLLKIEPGQIAFRLTGLALTKKHDVDDDVRPGVGPEASLRHPDGGDEIGGISNVLARRSVRFVHRAMRGDEGCKPARLQQVDRSRDEVVVQPQAHRTIGAVGADGAIGKRRITDGEIEVHRQLGAREVRGEDASAGLQ